jgi:hypothetical protein
MTSLKLALAASVAALMIGLAGGASAATGPAVQTLAPVSAPAIAADASVLKVAEVEIEWEVEFDEDDWDDEDEDDCDDDEDDCDWDDDEWEGDFEFEVVL